MEYFIKRFDIKIISITKNANSSLGKAGTVVLELPKQGEACPLGSHGHHPLRGPHDAADRDVAFCVRSYAGAAF